jgi:hypothetical protein
MDENNNQCGRDIVDRIRPDQACLNACEVALLNGELEMLPPADWTHFEDTTQAEMEAEWSQWQKDGVRSEYYGPWW